MRGCEARCERKPGKADCATIGEHARPCDCNSFATHLLNDGSGIRTPQELVGHKEVATMMNDTHVLNRGAVGMRSPADRLMEDR